MEGSFEFGYLSVNFLRAKVWFNDRRSFLVEGQ